MFRSFACFAFGDEQHNVLTLGMTWYQNPYVKWMLNFDRTVFDGSTSAARMPENTLALRAQLGF